MLRMVQDLASGIPAAERAGLGLCHSCSGRIQPKRSEEIPHSPAGGSLCFFLFPSSAYESKLSTLRMKTKKSPAFYAEDFLLVA